jgi:transposase
MDEFEQRFIAKYFHLKGRGNKKITAELESTFQGSALSRETVKRELRKFKTGDLSCHDQPRSRRPLTIFEPVLRKFLERCAFANTNAMSRHFNISPPTVKQILSREPGLEKCTRRRAPCELSEDQKKFRVDESRMLLDILHSYAEHNGERIATGDESWFRYSTYVDSLFAPSLEDVVQALVAPNGQYTHFSEVFGRATHDKATFDH